MRRICGFGEYLLPGSLRVFTCPSKRFKITTIRVYLAQPLEKRTATKISLLANLLKRGCKGFVNTRKMVRFLNILYGATLAIDVAKIGEVHVTSYTLRLPAQRYLPKTSKILPRGMDLLARMILKPVLEKGRFREDYFNQEKEKLRDFIRARINARGSYAMERCIQEMCKGERFSTLEYGEIEDLENITSEELSRYHKDYICSSMLDIYVYGDVDEQRILRLIEDRFYIKRRDPVSLPGDLVEKQIEREKLCIEEQEVKHARLVIGFRTYTSWRDDDIYGMIFFSNLLGGSAHSKLFLTVREKEGLAYHIRTRLEEMKGILLISAWIQHKDFERVLELVKAQIRQIALGDISAEEFESTRLSIMDDLRSVEDLPSRKMDLVYRMLLSGRVYEFNEILRRFESLGKDELARAAEKIKLDTVYLLKGKD